PLRAGDEARDAERGRTGQRGGCMLVLGILGGFVSLVLLGNRQPVGLFGLLVFGVLLVLGIVNLRRSGQLKAVDLDNARLALVQELLETLAPDLSEKRPLSLTLQHGDCFQWGPASNQRTEGT